MRWVGYAARVKIMIMKNSYKILVRISERNGSVGRYKPRRNDNIKKDAKERIM
jgi:hypothetical protein